MNQTNTGKIALVIAAVGCAIVAILVVSLRLNARDASTIGSATNPAVFLLSASHARNAKPESLATIARLLSEQSGLTVVVEVAKEPVAAIEAFGTEHADLALLNLTEYFLARQEFGVDARLQVLRDPTSARADAKRDAYYAVVAVRADSDVQDAAGLSGRRVAFVDEFSVSGFAYPAVLLKKAGADVVAEFAGSHEGAVQLVKEGRAVAAATYQELVEGDASLKIVARTSAIPNEPIVARRGLPNEVARKLVDAVSALAQNADGLAALRDVADIAAFAPATASSFDGALATLREAGRSADVLVPGGRALVMRNSPLLNVVNAVAN